jgi:hypothetical protein
MVRQAHHNHSVILSLSKDAKSGYRPGAHLVRMRDHDMLLLAGEQPQVAIKRAILRHPESWSGAFLMKMLRATDRRSVNIQRNIQDCSFTRGKKFK